MTDSVLSQITGLKTLDHDGLCRLWRTLYGKEPPAYNRTFLVSRLAYRIQELAYGGLRDDTKARMRDLLSSGGFDEIGGNRKRRKSGVRGSGKDSPVVGTRFVREWKGRRYEVVAVPGGFEYDGRLYRSLSAIAKAITGTHWNGKLFFGIARAGKAGGR
ncbi:MAG: DUF2924 domain-containing protein [Armatimonadota bacterium]